MINFRKDNKALQPLTLFSQSSLTDIILLLLIFFLLTSSFVTSFGIQVNVPRAESSITTDTEHISVAVTPEGHFFVNAERVDRAALANEIRRVHQNSPGGSLIIRADRDAIVDDAVYVMNIGRALNMNIVMATERD